MEKLTSKFGDINNDIEYWLKKLRKLKANDRSQIMKMADSVNEIFGEMEDAGVNLTEREKLKYMFNILPNDFKNIIDVTLETTARQLYFHIIVWR